MNCFASIEGKITKLWFSQNWDEFFYLFFFHWFCSISIYISSKFLATLRLIIIMYRPLVINDQKILLTLCTKFEMLVAPSKFFSKLLKVCMMYFIIKINKMGDEEVKNLKLDFSWITLMGMHRTTYLAVCHHFLNFVPDFVHLAQPNVSSKSLWSAANKAFSLAAPALWNQLPIAIRSSNSLHTFKKALNSNNIFIICCFSRACFI